MNYRLAALLDRETANTAATKPVDIDLAEPITAFSIQFQGTNTNSTPVAVPAKMVTKVELVDGSDVLDTLSGIQIEALEVSDTGRLACSERNFIAGNIAITVLELRFGRWLWDEQLALLPGKFKNLQLKITHNLAAGGCSSTAGQLSVFAHVFDEKAISPVGFLTNKQVHTFTLAGTTHSYVDLPVDLPLRKLMIQCLVADRQPCEEYNKIKLYTDEQKKIIINDIRTSDLLRCYAGKVNPYFIETIRAHWPASAVTHYLMSTFDTKIVGSGILGGTGYFQSDYSYGGSVDLAATSATEGDCIVSGKAPHGAFFIPMGKQDIIEDWFDATKVGSAKLDITGGSGSSGACNIVTQQLRRY